MALEIALRELRQCLVPLERFCRGDSLLQKRIGELLALTSAAADQSIQLGAHHDVTRPYRIIGMNSGFRQRITKLTAGKLFAALQDPLENPVAFAEDSLVEFILALVRSHDCVDPRCSQLHHPSDVRWCHE